MDPPPPDRGRQNPEKRERIARILPRLCFGLATLGALACLLPWHTQQSTRAFLCLAPDCRSSTYATTEVCTAANHPWIAVVIAISMAAVLVVQSLAGFRKTTRWRVIAGLASLVAAHVLGLVVVFFVYVAGHLFDKLTPHVGDVTFALVTCSLGLAAVLQVVTAGPKGGGAKAGERAASKRTGPGTSV